ncbi:MAG: phosphotyrosine protein phosphatase [Patescibacteria group bacterium]
MEDKHQDQLYRMFGKDFLPKVIVTNIPDEFEYMDPELIQILRAEIENILSV